MDPAIYYFVNMLFKSFYREVKNSFNNCQSLKTA